MQIKEIPPHQEFIRDLPASSTVPQPTTLPRAPCIDCKLHNLLWAKQTTVAISLKKTPFDYFSEMMQKKRFCYDKLKIQAWKKELL
jgi:hypothetical protein